MSQPYAHFYKGKVRAGGYSAFVFVCMCVCVRARVCVCVCVCVDV